MDYRQGIRRIHQFFFHLKVLFCIVALTYVNAGNVDKTKQKRGLLSQGLELPALDAHSHSGYHYDVPHSHVHSHSHDADIVASSSGPGLATSSLSGGYLPPSSNAEVHAAQEHLSAAQYSSGLGAANQVSAAQSHLNVAQLGGALGGHLGSGHGVSLGSGIGSTGLEGSLGSGIANGIGNGLGNGLLSGPGLSSPALVSGPTQIIQQVPIPVERHVAVDRPGKLS